MNTTYKDSPEVRRRTIKRVVWEGWCQELSTEDLHAGLQGTRRQLEAGEGDTVAMLCWREGAKAELLVREAQAILFTESRGQSPRESCST